MNLHSGLQLFMCLFMCTVNVQGIKVKFGTKDGPIEPPTPEPQPPPQPYRDPAPVWEERPDDTADPNAHWKPQLSIPQPRYTQVFFNPAPTQQPLNNVQRFANSYKPVHQPIQARPVIDYFKPAQILSSQSLPGFGIRYFVPKYVKDLQSRKEEKKQEDAKHNDIETNDIVGTENHDYNSDLLWKYEKDTTKRGLTNVLENKPARPIYVWPEYVQRRH
ncbi:uncharacterized protein LOC116765960 [Danaus plexippus]|uniref:uncharacterized protein LOC116765960 n=1 Tax=Danaus plexippus TaxID=13037 RepID=UPI002AAF55F7|nr:uncharacterized protein LOC116765960 [Danaus plexippus]